ncbi:hypothetical protein SLEP1_g37950 [Rubroshorea leprosula]|uniref:Uncharacterized protein n=1 Tax=Rubroshorea leprosula TaxID=152421 RepID=A0AAV5KWQ3_9ROSI|nr:hypothetical protein SLEP1_g37950 [Rubroshorea leprosula]
MVCMREALFFSLPFLVKNPYLIHMTGSSLLSAPLTYVVLIVLQNA